MHSFDPKVAEKVGVNAAVLHQNISWWCAKNAANGRHIHDGRAWTFNSKTAFAKLFPYLTAKQVRTALERLIDAGLLVTGVYNEDPRDRTLWYSASDLEGSPIGPVGPTDRPSGADHYQIRKPDEENADTREARSPPLIGAADTFDEWWSAYPKKVGKGAARKAFKAAAKKLGARGVPKLFSALELHKAVWRQSGTKRDFIPNPATWLNGERWDDDLPGDPKADAPPKRDPAPLIRHNVCVECDAAGGVHYEGCSRWRAPKDFMEEDE